MDEYKSLKDQKHNPRSKDQKDHHQKPTDKRSM